MPKGSMQRTETVEQYLARGGKITKQEEVKVISWAEARDLVEKLAYMAEDSKLSKKEDEAELDRLDAAEGFQVDYKEEEKVN